MLENRVYRTIRILRQPHLVACRMRFRSLSMRKLDDNLPAKTSFNYPTPHGVLLRTEHGIQNKTTQDMQKIHPLEEVLNTPQKKLAFFQNLVLIAAADGQLSAEESEFLLQIGNKLGLQPKEVLPMADNLGVLSFIVPAEGLQRTLELQTLVQMMLQNGRIDAREYGLCQEYAARIGYSKAILDDMVTQLSGGQPDPAPNPPTVS